MSESIHPEEITASLRPPAGIGEADATSRTAMSRKPLILLALLLAAFSINLDMTIVNVALPTLVRQLHASTSQLQWVVDAFNLVFAALLLASGSMSDRRGRKGMLLAGLALFGVASLAGGRTTSPGALIATRAFMGLGAAAVFRATLSLISNVFTGRAERARAIGLWGSSSYHPVLPILQGLQPAVGGGAPAPGRALHRTGMGLTSAPATEAIMGVVPLAKAGVGSAVNDATRLLGGTHGVAVIGSVYASLYASRLTAALPAHLAPALLDAAPRSAGAALAISHQLAQSGQPALGAAVHAATAGAFIHGLSVACLASSAIAGAGAVIAAALLPAQPAAPPLYERSEPAHVEPLSASAAPPATAALFSMPSTPSGYGPRNA